MTASSPTPTPPPNHSDAPLRVVFCSISGLFGGLVLRRLLTDPRINVVAIVLSTRVLKTRFGWLRGALEQIRLSGLAYAIYLWVISSVADLLAARSGGASIVAMARHKRIPLLTTRDINSDAGLGFLRQHQPDLLLSSFFNQKFGEKALTVPKLAAVNIHPGPLPDFRGVDPVLFCKLRDVAQLGVTVHAMDADFDTGAIWAEARWQPPADISLLAATARLFVLGGDLLLDQLDAIRSSKPARPQPASVGHYDSWPTRQDIAALRRRGMPLFRLADVRTLLNPARVDRDPP